ncbi:MAG: tRNA (adenosine(37)-N6)-threonylcarbamoyltransferase complex dimerization subunit type 1 TsaB [Burkholderiales bacterium]|nr:tRNA (adenosine(37)-N6)-threonylcarbamoyltransferase complex dimerization subunit type 1 TsaB [Burkholderiales bacterium]
MNILVIDTSSEYLSLALQFNNQQYHSLDFVINQQSNFIIPRIKELLDKCNIDINSIDAIAYNQGPGSFTGLRIGLSVAIGLAYSSNIKLIPIPSFLVYAQSIKNISNVGKVLIGIDARLNQIYFAAVELNTLKYCLQPEVVNPSEINSSLNKQDYICVGNGFRVYRELLPPPIKELTYIEMDYPSGLNILALVNAGYCPTLNKNLEVDLLYLRNKVALNIEEQKQIKLVITQPK